MTNSNTTAKFTKAMNYARLAEILDMVELEAEEKERLCRFIDHEVELIEKKAASKKSSTDTALEENKLLVLDILADLAKPVTVSEILKEDVPEGWTAPKVTAILQKLLAEGKVVNVKDKKKSLYSLATE
jgi:hypothetical protein